MDDKPKCTHPRITVMSTQEESVAVCEDCQANGHGATDQLAGEALAGRMLGVSYRKEAGDHQGQTVYVRVFQG